MKPSTTKLDVNQFHHPYIFYHFANYAHHKTFYTHLAYSHTLNEHCTQHCSLHSLVHKRKSISAMFSINKISQHNLLQNTIQTQLMHPTPSTTHPTDFHNPPMHTTNSKHSWQNGTRCRDSVKLIPTYFGWFLRVPCLHVIQKTFLWIP